MTPNEYQSLSMKSLNKDLTQPEWIMLAALGLGGESGEAIDIVKKWLFGGAELDKEHLIRELGDISWYIVLMCKALDVSFEEVLQKNIDKLNKRYPNGWNEYDANHRDTNDI